MLTWIRDPRRVALLLLAGMHLGMAATVSGDGYVWDEALLYHLLPTQVRIAMWLLAATLCGIGATSRRWQPIGYFAAMAMPVERAVSHIWAWVAWLVPGVPSGQPDGLGHALVWLCLAGLTLVLAGTRTAPPGGTDGG